MSEIQIKLRRKIGSAKTMDDIADLTSQSMGQVYFDKFRKLMAGFRQEEEKLLAVRQEESAATVSMTYTLLGFGTLIILILGGGLSWFVGDGIARPLNRMTEALRKLADGDTTREVDGAERGDEIGDMAKAAQVFRNNAIERASLMSESEKEQEVRAAPPETSRQSHFLPSATTVRSVMHTVSITIPVRWNPPQNRYHRSHRRQPLRPNSASAASEEASINVQNCGGSGGRVVRI